MRTAHIKEAALIAPNIFPCSSISLRKQVESPIEGKPNSFDDMDRSFPEGTQSAAEEIFDMELPS